MCVACGDPTHVGATIFVAGAAVDSAPAFGLNQIINQLRTQWSGSGEGTYRAWSGSNVTYSIADYYPTNAPYYEAGGVIMTTAMKSTARLAFELWDDLIAIDLNESFNSPAANITVNFANYTFDGNGNLSTAGGTYARPSLGSQSNGYYAILAQQIWLNKNWSSHDQDSDLYYGGYGVATYVHEVGHTLGLSHPGSYNAGSGNTITYANSAEFAQDNRQYSIMSYFGGYNPGTNSWTQDGTSSSWYYSSTPMVFDIAAIQATYGADFSTRAGDSTYGFNVTADVASRSANDLGVYSFSQNAHPIFTIWDGGGTDTLDCSGYSSSQTIDLRAGNYSSIGGMNGNVGIAYGCTIENAIGGSGADLLIGNDGNNVLAGRNGGDILDGFGGDDTAVFSGNLSSHTLQDRGAGGVAVLGPDGNDTLFAVEYLRFADGTIQVADGSMLFDSIYYDRTYLDVFHAGIGARTHYNAVGWHEGRDPNQYIDTSWYLAVNSDVRASGINPLQHYEQIGWREDRDPSPNFDVRLYLKNYPDVAAAGMDPLLHFLQFGQVEGRVAFQAIGTAFTGFDAQYYLKHNPDVAASGIDALTHFNVVGWREGRNPNALFDTAGYLAHYTDVRAAGINPLQHYEFSGWLEGRDPSTAFDTLHYLQAYTDVAAAHINPLDHYLNNGIYEGRSPFGDGIWH